MEEIYKLLPEITQLINNLEKGIKMLTHSFWLNRLGDVEEQYKETEDSLGELFDLIL